MGARRGQGRKVEERGREEGAARRKQQMRCKKGPKVDWDGRENKEM